MAATARLVLLAALATLAACASPPPSAGWTAAPAPLHDDDEVTDPELTTETKGVGHALLLWIPNRIFDALDIVRARVKFGPGFGFTLRATELLDLKLGAWEAGWIGLHGPRLEPVIPWPVGTEEYGATGFSIFEIENGDVLYGKGEFGVGVHVLIVGADAGVDVLEIADFITGLFFVDLVEDDF